MAVYPFNPQQASCILIALVRMNTLLMNMKLYKQYLFSKQMRLMHRPIMYNQVINGQATLYKCVEPYGRWGGKNHQNR